MNDAVLLRLAGVDKVFGKKTVLQNFSFTLPPGGTLALMGPSGSGKTTAAHIAMGLQVPDAGSVERAPGLRFSCVFQEDRLCESASAAANVALVLPRQSWGAVRPALAAVGLAQTEMEKPVSALSGGERRRVALVRAVQAQSDALVLDEAFKGLDVENRVRAVAYIKQNLRGRALLLITHSADDAAAFGAAVVQVPARAAAPAE